jgi:O-antigen/teichoic acid export membrane protein
MSIVPATPTPDPGSPDTRAIQRRIRLGMLALGARSVLQQLTILGANVYLARVLTPRDYGVFAIVQFAMSFFVVFGDVGLGPSLVQKQDTPNQTELSTVFWFQLGLSLAILGVLFVAAPYVLRLWPDLPADSPWLLRGLGLTFLFTVLRVVPSLLLERNLRFGWISVIEFAGTLAFYATAVVLAWRGASAASLVLASIAQTGFSAIALNLAQRWRPSWVFDTPSLRRMLRFGLNYQGKVVMGLINSSVTPLVAGIRLGGHGLGLVNFAQSTAWLPLQLVSIVGRVSFPAFSRLQHDRRALAAEIERAVVLCATATLFFVGLCVGIGPKLVEIIYSAKWLHAVPALYVYSLALAIGFNGPIVASALDALGKPQIVFRMSIVWSLINWASVLVATHFARTPLAFALGYAVHIVLGNLALIVVLRRMLPEARPLRRLLPGAIAALIVAGCGRFGLLPRLESGLGLAAAVVALAVTFLATSLALDPTLASTLRVALRGRAHPNAKAPAEKALDSS